MTGLSRGRHVERAGASPSCKTNPQTKLISAFPSKTHVGDKLSYQGTFKRLVAYTIKQTSRESHYEFDVCAGRVVILLPTHPLRPSPPTSQPLTPQHPAATEPAQGWGECGRLALYAFVQFYSRVYSCFQTQFCIRVFTLS